MAAMTMGPILFEPYLRPQIWGGRALGERFGKRLPTADAYGESWEVSGHPHHVSVVREGLLAGRRLTELVQTHSEDLFGAEWSGGDFPLLVKLLDCEQLLSVQVHPDDATAARLRPGERGKTEAWVVLEAAPTAEIYAGLKPGVSEEDFRRHVREGTTGECLHRFRPKAGDCIFIRAGTVHTLGGGVLVAEVQQSSDATFRLFDWNRVGRDGRPRPLHIEESLASIDWSAGPVQPARPTPMDVDAPGVRGEHLASCEFFRLDRYEATGAFPNPHTGSMSIWTTVEGEAVLECDGARRTFRRGETVLLPAACPAARWRAASPSNSAQLLSITLPTTASR